MRLSHPALSPEKIELLFPLAFSWYQSVEAEYISHGRRALSDQEIVIARKLGVTNPVNVRIVVLTEFPFTDGYRTVGRG